MIPASAALRALIVLAVAHALATVVVHGIQGGLPDAWYLASLTLYGSLLVLALAFAGRSPAASGAREAPVEVTARDVAYLTTVGGVVRTEIARGGERRAGYFAFTRRGVLPIRAIEAAVDAAELPASPYRTRDVERALDRRAALAPPPNATPHEVTP